jgi:ABC-type glycerol-3-phosphate transport system substrate-binding protein
MQTIVDNYNESQDRVHVEYLSTSQIDRKLLLATAGGDPPDVAGFWPHLIPAYVEKGALLPLDRLMERDGLSWDAYVPAVARLCRFRGFTWGLPTTPATLALHYNKRLFREAGLDPEHPPRTIEELDAYARRLTRLDDRGNIRQLGFNPSDPGWWNPLWGYWFGGHLVEGDSITADSPGCVAAYRWVQSYPERYGTREIQSFQAAGGGQFASSQNPFIAGKLAMQIQGVWMGNFIEKFNPDLEWGAAPFPAVSEDLADTTLVECDVLVIPRGSRHAEEAWDFIQFVEKQANMETLCLLQKKFSPLQEVSRGFYEQHPNPYIRLFRRLAESPNARTVPQISIYNEYSDEMVGAYDKVWLRIETPEKALGAVTDRMQPKFDRVLHQWKRVEEQRLRQWREL